jgi:hypothetical protein
VYGGSRDFVKVARLAFERFIRQPAKENQSNNRGRKAQQE